MNTAQNIEENFNHDLTPLCVDLDNSLISTDMLYEQFIYSLKTNPVKLLLIIFSIFSGKHIFKSKLSQLYKTNYELIPVNQNVLDFCQSQVDNGVPVYLVTGTHIDIAKKFLKAHPIFTDVLATNDKLNLTGINKKNVLVDKFGENGFHYLGDSNHDFHVWNSAGKAYYVGDSSSMKKKIPNLAASFSSPKKILKPFFKGLRTYQWAKNALIFTPFILAHDYSNIAHWKSSLIAFIGFSLLASGVYFLNDLFDLENDRAHPEKKHRPLASGAFPLHYGILISFALPIAGLLIGSSVGVLKMMLVYFSLNILYSSFFKKVAILDVFLLTSFYLIRIGIGSAATGVPVSSWLQIFSFFLFLSLAFLKRYIEVKQLFQNEGTTFSPGRGYSIQDVQYLFITGNGCGLMSALVFAVYINDTNVNQFYSNTDYLWFICVFLSYWITSLWFKASKGLVRYDPVKFALKDPTSYAILGAIAFIMYLST